MLIVNVQYYIGKLCRSILIQLKHCLALAICEIEYSACGLDANKALGFASCFISISAAHLVLYFTYSTRGNALTNTYCCSVALSHSLLTTKEVWD